MDSKRFIFFIILLISVNFIFAQQTNTAYAFNSLSLPGFNNNTAFVNASQFWNTLSLGPLDDANNTQFNGVLQTLTIDESWLTLFGDGQWLNLSGGNANQNIDIGAFDFAATNFNVGQNITIGDKICFDSDCEHFMTSNRDGPFFGGISNHSTWLGETRIDNRGDISYLITSENKTNLWLQTGRNFSFGGFGNSFGLIPNYMAEENFTEGGIINLSKTSDYIFLCTIFNVTCLFTADTRGNAIDLLPGGPLLWTMGDLEVWQSMNVLRGGTVHENFDVVLTGGNDVDIIGGGLHVRDSRIELVGFPINAQVTRLFADFEDDVLDPMVLGNATASTEANVTRFDSEFRLGDGSLRGDGSGRSIHDIFWNDSSLTLELPGNTSFTDVTEVTLNVTQNASIGDTLRVDFIEPLNTGEITLRSDVVIPFDDTKIFFGASQDASIFYSPSFGNNLVLNPKEVGSGHVLVLGDLTATVLRATSAVSTSTLDDVSDATVIDVDNHFLLDTGGNNILDFFDVGVAQFLANNIRTTGNISGENIFASGNVTTSLIESNTGTITFAGVGGSNNENINFDMESGNRVRFFSDTGASLKLEMTLVFGDDQAETFGNGADYRVNWETTAIDSFQTSTKVGSNSFSGYVTLIEDGDRGISSRSPASSSLNPIWRVYSSDGSQANDYIEMYHNQTNGVINVGNGNLNIGDGATQQNITMTSPDGTDFNCGVSNGGTFSCS